VLPRASRDDAIARGREGAGHGESEPAGCRPVTMTFWHWSLSSLAQTRGKRGRRSVKLSPLDHHEARRLDMNPAVLSTSLGALFPAGRRPPQTLRGRGNPDQLLAAEAMYVGRAVPKRVQELRRGRLCARRALAEFGIVRFSPSG